ncbi:alpha/beta hydrolase [Usitatibacter palustris]|uniref:Putative N-octanoylanthranilate hydrolase AqdA1 n=1 Tax=Usitatibacter palustris TaxID=2732487 RepID=A0A6M4H434_9PROT|nr:alpha/beta hydrolase [Usitatibacter palustris]QJR14042.1 putative N-octanoylanthranilate hydrolase AqdA1 [Usitatibacter palustris]
MQPPSFPAWDPATVEREYNNRLAVPEHPKFFERWERDSEFARKSLSSRLDLAYGPDPRHRIDLFPAKNPRGTLIFIHGGYWRALDKRMFAWLAPSWVAAGVNVANVNYRLCPQVGLDDITEDVLSATNLLMAQEFTQGPVVVSGHSAGGYQVAALFATPRDRLAFDPARIVGGVSISGLFELEPLLHYSANEDLRLDLDSARRLSLLEARRTITAPLVVAAGGAETSEFQRQSLDFADAWSPQTRTSLILPGLNHFSILDAFIERGQPLHRESLALLEK